LIIERGGNKMLSQQELEQTIILNYLMNARTANRKDLQNALYAHSNVQVSFIKNIVLSLEKRFKMLGINLFNVSANIATTYSISQEAHRFTMSKLLTPIYDEEGELESGLYQHPIVLSKERRMLI
tara:strand:- start:200 stop:574 length:375 start_codon:yes stop_codon:yes gene_type:complete